MKMTEIKGLETKELAEKLETASERLQRHTHAGRT